MYSTDPSSEEDLIDNFKKKKKKVSFLQARLKEKIDEESSMRSYNYRLNRVLTPKMSLESN